MLTRHQRIEELYPSEPMLREFAARRGAADRSAGRVGRSSSTCSRRRPILEAALAFLAAHPDATIVAGATDVGVRVNKSLSDARERFSISTASPNWTDVGDRERRAGARRAGKLDGDLNRSAKTLVPEFDKIVVDVRRAANSPRRHDRRQHRQRLADRRLAAVSAT